MSFSQILNQDLEQGKSMGKPIVHENVKKKMDIENFIIVALQMFRREF